MDLKFAMRQFRRSPGFTLLDVAILALGIGANSELFSVVYAIVLHPLAHLEPVSSRSAMPIGTAEVRPGLES
jgi:putative ABC transport system permease protein